jgi:hypothetical protein
MTRSGVNPFTNGQPPRGPKAERGQGNQADAGGHACERWQTRST